MNAHAMARASRIANRIASSISPHEGPFCGGSCWGSGGFCIDSVYGLRDACRLVPQKSNCHSKRYSNTISSNLCLTRCKECNPQQPLDRSRP